MKRSIRFWTKTRARLGLKQQAKKRRRTRTCQFESLEQRQLLAANLTDFELVSSWIENGQLHTDDPTLRGTVSGNIGGSSGDGSAMIEIDLAADGYVDYYTYASGADPTFSFDPRDYDDPSIMSFETAGVKTLKHRVIEFDYNGNLIRTGNWSSEYNFNLAENGSNSASGSGSSSGSSYSSGSGGSDPGVAVVSVYANDSYAAESGSDTGQFRFERTGDATGVLTVSFSLSSGSGYADTSDIQETFDEHPADPSLYTVVFDAGQSETILTVTPVEDEVDESLGETFEISLSSGTGYTVGSSHAAVSIDEGESSTAKPSNDGSTEESYATDAENSPPELSAIETAFMTYEVDEYAFARSLTSSIVVFDPDDDEILSAAVQIVSGYVNNADLLSFDGEDGSPITAVWNSNAGVLTLSGAASIGAYQAAFRNVAFSTTSDALDYSRRQIAFSVNDGERTSNQVIRYVLVRGPASRPPEFEDASINLSLPESHEAGAICAVAAIDPEGLAVTYSLEDERRFDGGTADYYFAEIPAFTVSNAGVVSLMGELDFESTQRYELYIKATDAGGNSSTAIVSIDVEDVEESPSFSKSTFAVNVNEDEAVGSVIVEVVATDPQSVAQGIESHPLTYTLIDDAGGRFEIAHPSSGRITLVHGLDFEGTRSHNLSVRATDPDGNFATARVIVWVMGVDEPPDFVSDVEVEVEENSRFVQLLSAIDPEGAIVAYSIAGGDDAHRFEIASTNTLQFRSIPDYEAPIDTNGDNIYVLQV